MGLKTCFRCQNCSHYVNKRSHACSFICSVVRESSVYSVRRMLFTQVLVCFVLWIFGHVEVANGVGYFLWAKCCELKMWSWRWKWAAHSWVTACWEDLFWRWGVCVWSDAGVGMWIYVRILVPTTFLHVVFTASLCRCIHYPNLCFCWCVQINLWYHLSLLVMFDSPISLLFPPLYLYQLLSTLRHKFNLRT